MIIIGCDYHPGFQQIAFVDTDTGIGAPGRSGKVLSRSRSPGSSGTFRDGSEWARSLV